MIVLGCLPTYTAGAQSLTTLYSFTGGSDGGGPYAGLVQASDGNLYGATIAEGPLDRATIYRITTSGAFTTLHAFTGTDGAGSYAALVQASDGNLYGTVTQGGFYNRGSVFRLTPNGVFTTLYSFSGVNDGEYPYGSLIQASDGNLYGTTQQGGSGLYGEWGTVFRITTSGSLTILYSFSGGGDGGNPESGLVDAVDGNLYGTTYNGGSGLCGTIFRITTGGALTTLYSFTGGTDGRAPTAGLVQATDGNFYGTTLYGGAFSTQPGGDGTVFRMTPGGTFTSLYSFTGGSDGYYPIAGLVQATDGNLYGTASDLGVSNLGSLFQITTGGTFTTLFSFTGGNDAGGPYAGLIQATDGYFYGTAYAGGAYGYGTVFSLSLSNALVLDSFVIALSPVLGSLHALGTVTLSSPAPPGGATVTLANTCSAAAVPQTVVIAAGAASATFSIPTSAVTSVTSGIVTAIYRGGSAQAAITVLPISVRSLTAEPTSVVGGKLNPVGTVTLEAPAAPGGIRVKLASNNLSAAEPAADGFIIPSGATTGRFTLNTFPVSTRQSVKITAIANGRSQSLVVTVRP